MLEKMLDARSKSATALKDSEFRKFKEKLRKSFKFDTAV